MALSFRLMYRFNEMICVRDIKWKVIYDIFRFCCYTLNQNYSEFLDITTHYVNYSFGLSFFNIFIHLLFLKSEQRRFARKKGKVLLCYTIFVFFSSDFFAPLSVWKISLLKLKASVFKGFAQYAIGICFVLLKYLIDILITL